VRPAELQRRTFPTERSIPGAERARLGVGSGDMARPSSVSAAFLACLSACGSRTELPVSASGDGGTTKIPEGGPLLDAASPFGDARPEAAMGCTRPPTEVAYLLDGEGALYRYDPVKGKATLLGTPSCGDENIAWTMTASGTTAFILYTGDWNLYAVDIATLACTLTPFQNGQLGLDAEYGFAAVGDPVPTQLYFYGIPDGQDQTILAVSDTTSFVLSPVGPITPQPPSGLVVNLTADKLGNLYAYAPTGYLQRIDPVTAAALQVVQTDVLTEGTWGTLAYGTELILLAETDAVVYDLAAMARQSTRDIHVAHIGAGASLVCP
jgi:hypothetical protein